MGLDLDPSAPVPLHEVISIPACGEEGRDELKRQCFDLRIAVFVHEQGFPLEVEIDHEDDRATHFLVRLLPSLKPVGTIRAVTVNSPTFPPTTKAPSATISLPLTHELKSNSQKPSAVDVDPVTDYESEPATTERYYKLGRLVVLKEHRQHRFGRALVLAVHDWVQRQEAATNSITTMTSGSSSSRSTPRSVRIVSHSQLPVVKFYAKYGYIPEGDIFDEDGAPHQKMVAYLPVPVVPPNSST